MKRTFKRSFLYDELDLPARPGKYDSVEVLAETLLDSRRWSLDYELVFRLPDQPEGEAWRVYYSVGATEQQDERAWEYEEEVEATLVRQVLKVVTVWAPPGEATPAPPPPAAALRVRLPTASSLALAAACPASHALPWAREVSGAMSRGTAVHKFLERLPEVGRERALEEVPEEHREICAAIDPAQVPDGAREVAYAWHAVTGEVVPLGAGWNRQYTRAIVAAGRDPAEPWIYGTADVEAYGPEVDDYKVTDNAYDEASLLRRPGEAPQLRFLGLCVGRRSSAGGVTVAHLRVASDGKIWRDAAHLSRFDLAVVEEELGATVRAVRAAGAQVAAGRAPDVTPGDHCKLCPAAAGCPATTALARQVARLVGADARLLGREQAAAAWAFLGRVEAWAKLLRAEIQRAARCAPIPLPDGQELREVPVEKEFLRGAVAYDVLRERLGEEAARALLKVNKGDVTKAAGGAKAARALLEEIRARGGTEIRVEHQVKEVAAPAPTVAAVELNNGVRLALVGATPEHSEEMRAAAESQRGAEEQ